MLLLRKRVRCGCLCARGSGSVTLCGAGYFGAPPSCQSEWLRRSTYLCVTFLTLLPSWLVACTVTSAACPAGVYCPAGTLDLLTVQPCAAAPGSYCPPGAPDRMLCPAQYFCTGGSALAQLCAAPPGFACFLEGNSNRSGEGCPSASFCIGGSSLPQTCTPGAYCPV